MLRYDVERIGGLNGCIKGMVFHAGVLGRSENSRLLESEELHMCITAASFVAQM